MDSVDIELPYGRDVILNMSVPRSLLAAYHVGPPEVDDLDRRIASVLASPLDFPALKQAVATNGPILVEVVCDPSEVILPMIPSGGGFDDMIITRPPKEKSASKKKRKGGKS